MINEAILERIKPGATVRVFEILKDGEKQQIRRFEGLVLARKHGSEAGATFTVRSTVAGVGVEKVFPLHSPTLDKVEILSSPKKVKKSKLYFTRLLSRKAIRKKTSIPEGADISFLPEEKPEEKKAVSSEVDKKEDAEVAEKEIDETKKEDAEKKDDMKEEEKKTEESKEGKEEKSAE